ncbi:MAG: HEAT repeat domain-containing protein [Phycisphaerales bacterium]|nr:HEAT repeat domain-containing protein [Phycisphaerales bacterium]
MMAWSVRTHRLVLVLGLLACVSGGCVTDDFKDIGATFFAPSPVDAARDALDPYNPDLRREGVVLLSNAPFGGVDAYLKMYRDYVANDPDPLVRAAAITALARHGDAADAMLIAPFLDRRVEENETVRWYAALALQRLHNPEVVSVMETTMRDEEETGEIRAALCVAMGQYPEDRVVQLLLFGLDSRELSVNTESAESLRMLTGQEFGLDSLAWKNWYDSALASDTAFKDQQEYLYPTYSRDTSWWEYAAFWMDVSWEKPSVPTGKRSRSERRTYDDLDAEAVAEDAGTTRQVETVDDTP